MQQATALILAAAIVAASILAGENWFQNRFRYAIAASSAEGSSAWRIDRQTGRVSVCGTMLTGAALSQMQNANDAAGLSATISGNKDAIATYFKASQNLDTLSTPHCSGWSSNSDGQ